MTKGRIVTPGPYNNVQ